MVDREHLAQVARKGPEPIFATISGAHLYGFASPDSDVDLRGAFMLPARDVLGLHPPDEATLAPGSRKQHADPDAGLHLVTAKSDEQQWPQDQNIACARRAWHVLIERNVQDLPSRA